MITVRGEVALLLSTKSAPAPERIWVALGELDRLAADEIAARLHSEGVLGAGTVAAVVSCAEESTQVWSRGDWSLHSEQGALPNGDELHGTAGFLRTTTGPGHTVRLALQVDADAIAGPHAHWWPLDEGMVRGSGLRRIAPGVPPVHQPTVAEPEGAAPPAGGGVVESSVVRRFLLGPSSPARPGEPQADEIDADSGHGVVEPAERERVSIATLLPHDLFNDDEGRDESPDDSAGPPLQVSASPSPANWPPPAAVDGWLPKMPDGWVARRNPRRSGTAADRTPAQAASPLEARATPAPARGVRLPSIRPTMVPALPTVVSAQPAPVSALDPARRDLDIRPPGPASSDPTPDFGITVFRPDLMGALGTALAAPGVPAVHCPAGHASPPNSDTCRVCGQTIADRSVVAVPNPQLGRLCRTGAPDVPVHGPMLFGRRPEWHGEGDRPALVTLEDPDQSVSRTHLSVTVAGWDVAVTDLGTPNGTTLQLPTGQTRRLVPHRPVTIAPSTVIVLGDVVPIWFEVP